MPAFVVVAVDVLPPPLQRVFVPSRPPLITVCPIFTLRRNIKFLSHHHHHSRPASPLLLHPVPSPTSRLLWQIWSVKQDSRSLIRQSLSIYYHFISQRLFPQHKTKNGRAKDGPFFLQLLAAAATMLLVTNFLPFLFTLRNTFLASAFANLLVVDERTGMEFLHFQFHSVAFCKIEYNFWFCHTFMRS